MKNFRYHGGKILAERMRSGNNHVPHLAVLKEKEEIDQVGAWFFVPMGEVPRGPPKDR